MYYRHYQELKRAERLNDSNAKKIGACLTCRYWDVEGPRGENLVPAEARCLHPELKKFQLIVSGGSACNAWERQPGVSEEAENYSRRFAEAEAER